ncbi:hypothetical protein CERZMDRAFT_82997 [Cercospora zeae-maydis SCOH1-5]|uniref:EGF-like domain-containing protein n=1 Tax=Cercospora zeae-maydis SCOH1-5 TaxID=717836 RepID=A0A6A6FLK2_9PEZI|nr:hypothetical protein CERZMDRAFT_82997 [Cercospora zeae-maydis SCOH1-5]
MSRHYYDPGYGEPQSEGLRPHESPRQRQNVHPSSRSSPRSGFAAADRVRGPPAMRPDHHPGPPPARDPRRVQAPQQHYYPPSNPTWQSSEHLYDGSAYDGSAYDGSAYDYHEDYGQDDQWPLPQSPAARPPRDGSNSPRRAPPRPQRPDETPARADYQRQARGPHRSMIPVAPSNRQHHQSPMRSHHGNGLWTGDGYSYVPPPDYPLPDRPHPNMGPGPNDNLSAIPPYPPPQAHQQGTYRQQENRRPPLGPPPSARRGPPSYYPQVAPVHPIQEETDSMRGSARTVSAHTAGHDSKTSFASSNAIPIGITQSHLDRGRAMPHPPPVQRPAPPSDTESEEGEYDDSPTEPAIARGEIRTPDAAAVVGSAKMETGLVRQASLGKRSKPTLTTVRSSDHIKRATEDAKSDVAPVISQRQSSVRGSTATADSPERTERSRALAQDTLEGHAQSGAESVGPESDVQREQEVIHAVAVAENKHEARPQDEESPRRKTPSEAFRAGTGFLDSTSLDHRPTLEPHESKELLGAAMPLRPQRSRPRSPLAPLDDPRRESIVHHLEKGGALSTEEAQELRRPMGGLSAREGRRRPPRLNVDAVKDAEARGSLTSLPDLIRRATKLASNLDRGKTASRMGMNWLEGTNNVDEKKRQSGSMSDILNAFPPPASLTPSESRNAFRRSLAAFSSKNRHSQLHSDSDAGALQRRRCCGMPQWLFICLLLLLLLLIAAAVVVPVMLVVVIPDQKNPGATKVGSCAAQLTCENGGANILGSDGDCECLCVNGYTGPTCSRQQESGCTSISTGSSGNATIGEALPRLLDSSEARFGIPLNGQELLGLFSRADLSCNVQNQLVTFDGKSSKRKRQDASSGIESGTLGATGSPTPGSTSSSTAASATGNSTIDFARVAVLYVFQDAKTLQAAADAQENLQSYLRDGSLADGSSASESNVTLGNGYEVDLNGFVLQVANGTRVGKGAQ